MKTRLLAAVVLAAVLLAAPLTLQAQGAALKPGDSAGTMTLRSGGAAGPPLWAFCSPAFLNPGVTTTACSVPPLPELAIGHGWFSADEALRDSNWAAMTWALDFDGQPVDLAAFGTFDADLPQTGLPGHAAGEEVITKLRSWDVVLVNPSAGPHTLRSVLTLSQDVDDGFHVTAAGAYELVVTFTVQAPTLPQTGGATPAAAPWVWLGAAGLLVLSVSLAFRRGVRRAQ